MERDHWAEKIEPVKNRKRIQKYLTYLNEKKMKVIVETKKNIEYY